MVSGFCSSPVLVGPLAFAMLVSCQKKLGQMGGRWRVYKVVTIAQDLGLLQPVIRIRRRQGSSFLILSTTLSGIIATILKARSPRGSAPRTGRQARARDLDDCEDGWGLASPIFQHRWSFIPIPRSRNWGGNFRVSGANDFP